jgi:GDPmannose 4,6-dehydratase
MYDPRCEGPLDEVGPMRPVTPYGVAKHFAHETVSLYRDHFGLFCVAGILFNHESPRRPESYVTRRITRGVAQIARGRAHELRLGNLDPRRDWGFAGDYALAMWLMLRQESPEDLVIGTGEAHSVREFCEAAFAAAGLRVDDHVVSDPALMRPNDVPVRLADPSRARSRLGWSASVDFQSLVHMMVQADLDAE